MLSLESNLQFVGKQIMKVIRLKPLLPGCQTKRPEKVHTTCIQNIIKNKKSNDSKNLFEHTPSNQHFLSGLTRT